MNANVAELFKGGTTKIKVQLAQMQADEQAQDRESMAAEYAELSSELAETVGPLEEKMKQLTDEVNKAQQKLQDKIHERGQVMSSISHHRERTYRRTKVLKNTLMETAPADLKSFISMCSAIESSCYCMLKRRHMVYPDDPRRKVKADWKALRERAKACRKKAQGLACKAADNYQQELDRLRRELNAPAELVARYNHD